MNELEKLANLGQNLRDALDGGKAMLSDYATRAGNAIRDGAHNLESAYSRVMRGAPGMLPENWSLRGAADSVMGAARDGANSLESAYTKAVRGLHPRLDPQYAGAAALGRAGQESAEELARRLLARTGN